MDAIKEKLTRIESQIKVSRNDIVEIIRMLVNLLSEPKESVPASEPEPEPEPEPADSSE
jgi:hypothetical protein